MFKRNSPDKNEASIGCVRETPPKKRRKIPTEKQSQHGMCKRNSPNKIETSTGCLRETPQIKKEASMGCVRETAQI